jgi:hypothetical protein
VEGGTTYKTRIDYPQVVEIVEAVKIRTDTLIINNFMLLLIKSFGFGIKRYCQL